MLYYFLVYEPSKDAFIESICDYACLTEKYYISYYQLTDRLHFYDVHTVLLKIENYLTGAIGCDSVETSHGDVPVDSNCCDEIGSSSVVG